MFKEVQKIKDVKAFQVGEYLCYLHTEGGIFCSNGFEYDTSTKGSIYLIRNILFKQSFRGELLVFDVERKECVFQNDRNEYKLFIDPNTPLEGESVIYSTRKVDKNETFGLFNFSDESFHRLGVEIGTCVPELGISLNWGGATQGINAKAFNSNNILWSFDDLSKYSNSYNDHLGEQVKNFLGVYNLEFWFALSSGKLLGLNVERGSLKHQIGFKESDLQQLPFEVNEGDYLPFGELMQLDEVKGEIIGLRDKYFMKVDLSQPEPSRKYIDVGQSMAAHDISSSYRNYAFPTDEEFIYFCDDRQGKIGIFDRSEIEVLWSHKLDMEYDGIAQILEMKYSDNRWYVLDRNDTLHIFERE